MGKRTVEGLKKLVKELDLKLNPRKKYNEIRWVGTDKSRIDETVKDVTWVYLEW